MDLQLDTEAVHREPPFQQRRSPGALITGVLLPDQPVMGTGVRGDGGQVVEIERCPTPPT